MLDVGPVVLHHHVGPGGQALEDRDPPRVLEVHRHASLVPVEVGRVEEDPLPPLPAGPLDPDHVGSEVSENLGAGGPGADGGQIDDGEPREGPTGGGLRHGDVV